MGLFVKAVDDGYGGIKYDLQPAGYVAFIIGMLLVLAIGALISSKIRGEEKQIGIRQLVFSAMAIALAMVASMIPMPRMPMGGHITLFSLFFITLIGYWYGLSGGIACGVAYGTLQLLLNPYILSLPQLLCDYIFAFGALGLSGILRQKRIKSVIPGYLLGVCGRYFFAVLSGVVFFAAYAPETGILSNAWLYSIVYNITYIGGEAVLTVLVLQIPAVRSAIDMIGRNTTQIEQ